MRSPSREPEAPNVRYQTNRISSRINSDHIPPNDNSRIYLFLASANVSLCRLADKGLVVLVVETGDDHLLDLPTVSQIVGGDHRLDHRVGNSRDPSGVVGRGRSDERARAVGPRVAGILEEAVAPSSALGVTHSSSGIFKEAVASSPARCCR